jgi:hypothetical protein
VLARLGALRHRCVRGLGHEDCDKRIGIKDACAS